MRLLIWLSGARPDILRQSPGDHAKYLGIGSAVLITAGIAAMSMTFALHTALKAALVVAIFFALLWGLAIMSIDRWLVASLHRPEGAAKSPGSRINYGWITYFLLISVRMALAILFGFVISTPFVLQIFAPEINKQITLIQRNEAASYFAHLKSDPLTKKIAADQANVDALNHTIISTGGASPDPYQDPTIANLVTQRNQQRKLVTTDYDQWQCQLYGVPASACRSGDGPLAKASHTTYLNAQAQLTQENQQIGTLVAQSIARGQSGRGKAVAAAHSNLPAAERQLRRDKAEQVGLTNSFEHQNASKAGLLLRLQALGNVTSGNSQLSAARWLLLALFTTIDCLPVLVKTLQNFQSENHYERLAALDEKKRLRVARETAEREERAEIIGTESIIEEAHRLAAEREKYLPAVRQQVISAEQRIAERIVEEWENRESLAVTGGSRWQRAGRELRRERPPRSRHARTPGLAPPVLTPRGTRPPGAWPQPDRPWGPPPAGADPQAATELPAEAGTDLEPVTARLRPWA
jgi:hypothetical protein